MKIQYNWRNLLYLAVICVMLAGIWDAYAFKQKAAYIRMIADVPFGMLDGAAPIADGQDKSPQARLLLHGKDGAESEAERWKPLWDSEPNNPVYFAEYVRAVFRETRTVPDDLLQQAGKIDPSNGWYLSLKASAMLHKLIDLEKLSKQEQKEMKAPQANVKDEAKLLEALELLHQAASMPRYESHFMAITRERIEALGPATDWLSMIPRIAYVAGIPSTGVLEMRDVSRALAVAATRSGERGDVAEFHKVTKIRHWLTRALLDDAGTMIDALIAKVCIYESAPAFRDAARKLGLEEEALKFESLARWHQQERESRSTRHDPSPEGFELEKKHSLIADLTLPMMDKQVRKPPVLTEEDLRPSRLAEHAFFLRIALRIACVLLLLLCAAAGIRLACVPIHLRQRSSALSDRLKARDWLDLILLGGILPLLAYSALLYFTPVSTRYWSIKLLGMVAMPLQLASLLVLVISLMAAMSSRLCDQRMAGECGASRFPRLRWIMAGFAIAGFLLTASMALPMHVPGLAEPLFWIVLWSAASLSALPLLWLVFRVLKPFFKLRDQTPRTATQTRMMVPGLMVIFLLFATAMPALHQEEIFWMTKDRLLVITPESPALSRYEWDCTRILVGELRETLDRAFPVDK